MIKTKAEIIEIVKELPTPLVGGMCFDNNKTINVRDSCIEMMNYVMDLSKPKKILETGCHVGTSSLLMLSLSMAHVTSTDIGMNWITERRSFKDWGIPDEDGTGLCKVEEVLLKHFPDRFRLIIGDSTSWQFYEFIKNEKFDLILIDGNHDFQYVKRDIELAIKLNIPYILLDDYNVRYDVVKIEKDKCERGKATRELDLIHIKTFESVHNNANIDVGFFKNPYYKAKPKNCLTIKLN